MSRLDARIRRLWLKIEGPPHDERGLETAVMVVLCTLLPTFAGLALAALLWLLR